MSVPVPDVLNDPSSTALDERDGKHIAQQAVGVMFEAVCPQASAMLVHADGRNSETALVTARSRDPRPGGTNAELVRHRLRPLLQ